MSQKEIHIPSTNIMNKNHWIEVDIINNTVEFQHIGSSRDRDTNLRDHILIKPDYLVVIGGKVQTPNKEYRQCCECFYGGERMKCIEKKLDEHHDVKDEPGIHDTYFPRFAEPKDGIKSSDDFYRLCRTRHLAQIASQAYRQTEEQK